MAERLPAVGAQLVSDIPRLEPVRDILLFQRTWFDGTNSPAPGISGNAIPVGARILLIADDYDVLESRKLSIAARLRVMEGRIGQYDPTLLAALRVALRNIPDTATGDESVVVRLERVRVGMIFAEDVIGPNELTLIGRGQEVTPALVERLRLLAAPLRERPVRMFPARFN
jgi:HD-GYP domain-containing protein (c-di-GMP phosphodiesterase class II)